MPEAKPLPPIDRLREVLDYDPATGVLIWTEARGPSWAGKVAGGVDSKGYLRVQVCGKRTTAQRICYALGTGIDPYPYEVDHINRDRGDNRLSNLRPATRQEQCDNRAPHPTIRPVRVTYPDGRSEVCGGVREAARLLGCARPTIDRALARPTGALMTAGRGAGGWVPSGIVVCYEV